MRLESIYRYLLFSAFSVFLPSEAPARAQVPASHLQVSVFNDAGVRWDVLGGAEARATVIFSQAGIQVEWINCGATDAADFSSRLTPCSGVSWPQHLSVRIRGRAKNVKEDVFGESFEDERGIGVYCTIYWGNLAASRKHPTVGQADMLGYALAHELGHLLLGASSHATRGVMQATWSIETLRAASLGALFFTTAETAVLRSRLANS